MKQGGKRTASGFTIVEVMIVLAVTGLVAISAMLLVNGRQNKTEFQTAINDVKQQIQQIINETVSGYFPGNGAITCNVGVPTKSPLPPILANVGGSPQAQGTNSACMFLGKFIQFGVHGTSPEQYPVYPIAGNRLDQSQSQASSLYGVTGTVPVAVAKGNTNNSGLTNAMVTTQVLKNGLSAITPNKMTYVKTAGGTATTGTVGFLNSLGSYSGSGCGGSLCSGAQQAGLYTAIGTTLNTDSPTAVDAIDANNGITQPGAVAEVDICFASGTTTQSGLVTIGGGSQRVSVTVKIFNTTNCT